MIRKLATLALGLTVVTAAQGQEKRDTVIVSLAKTSQVIFTMQDRSDLEILKHYNFQDLFHDILTRLEKTDSTTVALKKEPETITPATTEPTPEETPREEAKENWSSSSSENNANDNDEDDDEWQKKVEHRRGRIGRTWQSFNFDLGTNNYLSKGKFPDNNNAPYAVRPWGSWYVAAASTQRTRVGRNFFLEWGLGISWYSFKFQDDKTMIQKNDDGVLFLTDSRDVNNIKSKLSATYLTASFVPVLDFGGHNRKPRMWDGYNSAFRIGLGPYVGYRIASRSKFVYSDDGHREKEKDRDSLYLNNLRYGARLQIGFRSTDLFFNYDFNELFAAGKGPNLNAFSFGVIF